MTYENRNMIKNYKIETIFKLTVTSLFGKEVAQLKELKYIYKKKKILKAKLGERDRRTIRICRRNHRDDISRHRRESHKWKMDQRKRKEVFTDKK